MALDSDQKFSHSVATEAAWDPGLREYLNYRDLGIKDATNGDVIAHVVKAKEGHNATGQWHLHECDFQMYYVLEGWARFEYEGEGIKTVRKGDCVLQPRGIRHREIEHSADLEILEIVSPANFASRYVEAPEGQSVAAE